MVFRLPERDALQALRHVRDAMRQGKEFCSFHARFARFPEIHIAIVTLVSGQREGVSVTAEKDLAGRNTADSSQVLNRQDVSFDGADCDSGQAAE